MRNSAATSWCFTVRASMLARVALCLILPLCASCAEDSSPEVAGTGSSGGNPLTEDPISVTFQLQASEPSGAQRVRWMQAQLSPVTIRLGRSDEAGACQFDPGDRIDDVDLINFDRSAIDGVNARNLCAIRLTPGPDAPLLLVLGETPRFDIALSFWLDDGVELTLDLAQSWAEGRRDWVLVLSPEAMTRDVDLSTLADSEGRIVLSDRSPEFRDALRRRLGEAVRLYVDPTPGDGSVSEAEQTDENRIGGIRIVN